MQLLMHHGAQMEKDAYGMTPLVSAAVVGHKNVVEYLISRPDCPLEEKINSLELLGATYIDRKHNLVEGLRLWERAMQDRFPVTPEGATLTAMPKIVRESPVAVMLATKEFATLEELRFMGDNPNEIRVQALLVRERILGAAHPETSYLLRYRGAVFADQGTNKWSIFSLREAWLIVSAKIWKFTKLLDQSSTEASIILFHPLLYAPSSLFEMTFFLISRRFSALSAAVELRTGSAAGQSGAAESHDRLQFRLLCRTLLLQGDSAISLRRPEYHLVRL